MFSADVVVVREDEDILTSEIGIKIGGPFACATGIGRRGQPEPGEVIAILLAFGNEDVVVLGIEKFRQAMRNPRTFGGAFVPAPAVPMHLEKALVAGATDLQVWRAIGLPVNVLLDDLARCLRLLLGCPRRQTELLPNPVFALDAIVA